MLISLLTLCSIASAKNKIVEGCYERVYSANHMAAHVGQTLSAAKLKIVNYTEDGGYTNMYFSGISASDGRIYTFDGADRKDSDNAVCASFQADGDQQSGCIKVLRQNGNEILIAPLAKKYNSFGQAMVSKGITLMRCDGPSSDGEGCEQPGLSTISLLASNKEDSAYKLLKVKCTAD